MNTDVNDYRLADFKCLLPLRVDLRVLVIDVAEPAFALHLADDVATIDVAGAGPAFAQALQQHQQTGATTTAVRTVASAEGLYDLVVSDTVAAVRHLRAGGTFCHFSSTASALPIPGLELVGRWRALPAWPAFRALVPDTAAGWQAAVTHFRLLPRRSAAGLAALLSAPLAARLLPVHAITLYRQPGAASDSLLTTLDASLHGSHSAAEAAQLQAWMVVSGRLGPGNPVIGFRLDPNGRPLRLIKLARFAGSLHLQQEADKLQQIVDLLGARLSQVVIRPQALTRCNDRAALGYAFVPTHDFFGVRWHLQARRNYCLAMTQWLADCAVDTRHALDAAGTEQQHLAPLQRLLARRVLPADMQHAGSLALQWLQQQPLLPTVLEHGDLGIYNTRLTSADGSGFQILDWGSSTADGIALGDLLYLLSSAHAPAALAHQCIASYLQQLGLPLAAARPLWFSYLARRWEELDGVRPPDPRDASSGGGILLSIHARVLPLLAGI